MIRKALKWKLADQACRKEPRLFGSFSIAASCVLFHCDMRQFFEQVLLASMDRSIATRIARLKHQNAIPLDAAPAFYSAVYRTLESVSDRHKDAAPFCTAARNCTHSWLLAQGYQPSAVTKDFHYIHPVFSQWSNAELSIQYKGSAGVIRPHMSKGGGCWISATVIKAAQHSSSLGLTALMQCREAMRRQRGISAAVPFRMGEVFSLRPVKPAAAKDGDS